MRYREFNKSNLTEGKFGDMIDKVKSYAIRIVKQVRSALTNLGFGQKIVIQIKAPKPTGLVESGGIQSMYGYMAEYATCYRLTELIESNGISVSYKQGNSSAIFGKEAVAAALQFSDDYARSILNGRAKQKEISVQIEIQKRAGIEMANSMFNDAIIHGEDLGILHFEVMHTGESMKHETKADAIMTITKDNQSVIIDSLKASLKSYKKWSVNLNNSGITSIFSKKNLDMKIDAKLVESLKNTANLRTRLAVVYRNADKAYQIALQEENDAINRANEKTNSPTRLAAITTISNTAFDKIIKAAKTAIDNDSSTIPATWLALVSPQGSSIALFSEESLRTRAGIKVGKESPATLRDGFNAAWKTVAPAFLTKYAAALQGGYDANPQYVNTRLLELLGFDGEDDFLLTVHNDVSDTFETVSSRTSENYKKLIRQFHSGFSVKFIHDGYATSMITVIFYDPDDNIIINTSLGIGVSGTSKGQKNNWWVPLGLTRDSNLI